MQQSLPQLEPYCTAIFGQADRRSGVCRYSLPRLAKKIREDFCWLLEHGYTCFIVCVSCSYGRLAYQELCRARGNGAAFRLYAVEIKGQIIRKGHLKRISVDELDSTVHITDFPPEAFLERCLRRASVFCSPRGRLLLAGEPPQAMRNYYQGLLK